MEKESLGFIFGEGSQPKTNNMSLVVSGVLVFICALVIGILFMMPSKKPRKKRANELVEDYEYTKA